MGTPGWKAGEPEDPEPEPLPERDWTDLELRAWVEKRKWQAGKDAEWLQRQQDVGRYALGLHFGLRLLAMPCYAMLLLVVASAWSQMVALKEQS